MKTFPEQLLDARKASGMTQEQLAERMNVSRPMISHWETGRSLPDLETVRRLSQILDHNFLQEGAQDFVGQPEVSDASAGRVPKKMRGRTAVLGFLAGAAVMVVAALLIFLPMLPKEGAVLPQDTPENMAQGIVKAAYMPYGVGIGSPEWYRQPNERVEGQAYIAIATPKNPLYAALMEDGTGVGWNYEFYFEEQNDIDFIVDEFMVTMFYTETRSFSDRFDAQELASWWADNTIFAGRQQMYSGTIPRQPMIGIGIVLAGTDANGNQLAFRYYLELSRELETTPIAQETPTEEDAAITEMLAHYKQPNERIEGQAYVNITVAEDPLRLIRSDRFSNGLGWYYTFMLQEENGIDFIVEEVTDVRFFSETRVDIFTFDPVDAWNTSVLPGGGDAFRSNGGFHILDDVLGVGFMITGTDANGNAREFHYYLELSHEIAE